jgi:hypothetical protein
MSGNWRRINVNGKPDTAGSMKKLIRGITAVLPDGNLTVREYGRMASKLTSTPLMMDR